jgi:hypothetical protein
VFLDWKALTGQRALNDEQVLGLDDPYVGWNHVARGELDDVAWHELRERELARLAIAERRRVDRDHRLELRRAQARPDLLEQLESDAEHDHQRHHRGSARIAGRERDCGEDREQDHERVQDGTPQQLEKAWTLIVRKDVGAVLGESRSSLVGGQPIETRRESREDGVGLQRRRFQQQRRDPDHGRTATTAGKHALREDRVRHRHLRTVA